MIPAWIPLSGLGVSLAGLLAVVLAPALPRVKKLWFILTAAVCILWGGIGAGSGFEFMAETGVFDAGSWIDFENTTLNARWTYAPWASGSTFKWCYRYKYGSEHKGPFQLPDADVSACAASFKLDIPEGEEWRDLIVYCYTEYVAPPTVVTNGVYHLGGVSRDMSGGDKFVTPKVEIVVNLESGERVTLTPTNQLPKVKGIAE